MKLLPKRILNFQNLILVWIARFSGQMNTVVTCSSIPSVSSRRNVYLKKVSYLKRRDFQLLQGSFYRDYHLQQIKRKIIVVTFLHLPNPSVYVN